MSRLQQAWGGLDGDNANDHKGDDLVVDVGEEGAPAAGVGQSDHTRKFPMMGK